MRVDDDMLVRLGISRFGVNEEGEKEASRSVMSKLDWLIARLKLLKVWRVIVIGSRRQTAAARCKG